MTIDIEFGSVKMFDLNRGFGFIFPDREGENVFFHRTRVSDLETMLQLRPNTRIAFVRDVTNDERASIVWLECADQVSRIAGQSEITRAGREGVTNSKPSESCSGSRAHSMTVYGANSRKRG